MFFYPPSFVRRGTTLIELLLFLAFFGLSSGVLLAFFFMTTEQRVRQQTIATVEQSGVQIAQTLTSRIRNAERILSPAIGSSGSIVVLQLSDDTVHPTIIALSGSTLYTGEANTLKAISTDDVRITNLLFQNTSSAIDKPSILFQFEAVRTVPLSVHLEYERLFEALVPLFPDDSPSPPCNCALPECTAGNLSWQYCKDAVCTDAEVTLPCV